jgi:RimJ/RimL family protein N-acetyltransferase
VASTPEAIRKQLQGAPDSVIFGAFRPGLVGSVGLYRDRHVKCFHKIHLWGMYVSPDHRRQGVATELLRGALHHARALQGVSWVHLSVSSAAVEARRLYERAGFRLWGTEPEALLYEGQAVAEHHMALRFD